MRAGCVPCLTHQRQRQTSPGGRRRAAALAQTEPGADSYPRPHFARAVHTLSFRTRTGPLRQSTRRNRQ